MILYGVWHPAPFLMNTATLVALLVFAVANGVLSNAGEAPTTEDETAQSSLERNQEGVSV